MNSMQERLVGSFQGKTQLVMRRSMVGIVSTHAEIVLRYLADTQSISITDNGRSVKVYFSLRAQQDAPNATALDPHVEASRRVQLLHRLFPTEGDL